MRRILLLIAISLIVESSPSNNSHALLSKPNGHHLKILTWNVQMVPSIGSIFSKSLKKMQEERTEWIIEHLSNKDYDIILLQECFDKDFIENLNAKLIEKYPFQLNPNKPKWYKLSNGLMVLSKIPLEVMDRISFSHSAQTDMLVSKGADLVRVQIDSMQIHIINTHLQSDYDEAKFSKIRNQQLDEIQSKLISNYTDTLDKIIVAGDLNIEENLESVEYKDMIRRFHFIDLVYNFFRKNTISFDKNNFWNNEVDASTRLDYFLTNLKFAPNDVEIVMAKRKYQATEIDLADHYGISAEFRLN